jgi:hypothetical protein
LELLFEAKGKRFIAVDAEWKKNGYRVYDILDETESYIDTVMVHPLDSILDAVDEWAKRYRGSSGFIGWTKWFAALAHGV